MSRPSCIAPDLTVRQVAAACPSCAALLERYPDARLDGRWTLQELAPFARDHELDESTFLQELARAAGVPVRERARPGRESAPIPLLFLAIALGLTAGAGWGVALLLRIAFAVDYGSISGASVHVHGLAQLWGWMGLFIFAVATHLLRQNSKRPAPAWLEYIGATAITAALGLFFATLLSPREGNLAGADVVASALLGLAALSFGVSTIWSLWGRGQAPQFWHGFVIVMVAWLWGWAGADVYLRWRHAGARPLPDAARELLIVLPVLGFATNAIYGFGIRLVPGLLNIGRLRPGCFAASLVMHNAGLGLFLTPWLIPRATGSALMLLASCIYVLGLDFLRSRPSRPIYGVDPRGHILIRVAFFWLVVGLGMILVQQLAPALPHAYSGAWRHALTVGFITTMILGVAQRIVPVFIRQPLASTRLMLVGGALIIVGNAGRVGLELLTMGGWPWTYRLMGLTGLLELSALTLFAINLLLTALARRRVYSPDQPLTPDTRVREAINARPVVQQRLREMDVTMFDDAQFVAPSMTFGALALAWGREPSEFLEELCATKGR